MSQHLAYIDPDEEIISVISRLRKVGEVDVFFVVPKRALFLQSMVNLRLLERESKKLGKRVCLVTQDDVGRSLAEKAGLETAPSLEGVEGSGSKAMDTALPARLSQVDRSVSMESQHVPSSPKSVALLHSESIGSSKFFVEKESAIDFPVGYDRGSDAIHHASVPASTPVVPFTQSVLVRDRTPKRLTTLNSTRNDPLSLESQPPVSKDASSRVSFVFPSPSSAAPSFPSPPLSQIPQPVPLSKYSQSPLDSKNPQTSSGYRAPVQLPSVQESQGRVSTAFASHQETPIGRFYHNQNKDGIQSAREDRRATSNASLDGIGGNGGRRRFRRIIFGCVAISLIAVLGVSVVVFVPRADVTVLVKELSASADAEINARADAKNVDIEGKIIPMRLVEIEKDITQSFPGTGQSSLSDKRARGMVTISNVFGATSQLLVATTRFETPEGKIFRLTKTLTVPGTKNENGKVVPGTVDAEVAADAAGSDYNIAPTSFTIPGLKGGPKYAAITAASTATFVGGGAGDAAVASVSADDVIRAKDAAEKKLPEALRAEIAKDLQPGEKLLNDAVLSQTLSEGAFPGAGAIASNFEYRIHVSARALVFSESDARTVAAALLGDGTRVEDVSVEYTVPRPDFTAKSMVVKAKVSVSKSQSLDIEAVKKDILGKSVGDVQTIFATYPNIQKIEVVFWPKFMTSRIPSRASQVSVHVETASEK